MRMNQRNRVYSIPRQNIRIQKDNQFILNLPLPFTRYGTLKFQFFKPRYLGTSEFFFSIDFNISLTTLIVLAVGHHFNINLFLIAVENSQSVLSLGIVLKIIFLLVFFLDFFTVGRFFFFFSSIEKYWRWKLGTASYTRYSPTQVQSKYSK